LLGRGDQPRRHDTLKDNLVTGGMGLGNGKKTTAKRKVTGEGSRKGKRKSKGPLRGKSEQPSGVSSCLEPCPCMYHRSDSLEDCERKREQKLDSLQGKEKRPAGQKSWASKLWVDACSGVIGILRKE